MKNEFQKRILSSIIIIPLSLFFIIKGSTFFILFLSILFVISSIEWIKMSKKVELKVFGLLFLAVSFYTAYLLRNNDLESFLLIITICVSTDIGGYIFGKLFKGPKLNKISPNKTYSGMIGSFLLSIIFANLYVVKFEFDFLINQNITIDTIFIILVLSISTTSQIGDLIISYFKRYSKIKNTGNIFPGHGGLLDRIDGMIFVFPITYLFFNFII